MAIVNMGFYREGDKLIEGAYSPLEAYSGDKTKHPNYFIYETDHGCCIAERERNGYHDSDFEILLWNPETKSASWYCYATTRAWCYPCYASRVDATPEVLEAYHQWEKERRERWDREEKIKAIQKQRELNRIDRQIARFYGVETAQVKKLRSFYHPDMVKAMHKLLSSNLRSEFRKSLRKQLIAWMEGKGKFEKPFSPKQLQYI